MLLAQKIFFQLATLLLIALAGWWMARRGVLTDYRPLNAVLVNIALPSLIIANLQIPYSAALLREMGLTLAGMFMILVIGGLLGALVAKLAGKTGRMRGTWAACVMLPNSVYMGQPLLSALYGERGLTLIAPISLIFNFMAFTAGVLMISGKKAGRGMLKDVLLKPVVAACYLGLILFFLPVRLPDFLRSALQMLASVTTPISMVVIGCQLAPLRLREIFLDRELYLLSLTRLLLPTAASYWILRLFIADPTILGVLMVCGCMPCAVLLPVIAEDQGGETLLCSKTVFISTLLCVITAPFLLQLLAAAP